MLLQFENVKYCGFRLDGIDNDTHFLCEFSPQTLTLPPRGESNGFTCLIRESIFASPIPESAPHARQY